MVRKKGFTIIEVVLVLAIAGLIFLMVFIALPALRRSQRNAQRVRDLARIASDITDYQVNNRYAFPAATDWEDFVMAYVDRACNDGAGNFSAADCSDQYRDPSGEPYGQIIFHDTHIGQIDHDYTRDFIVAEEAFCGATEGLPDYSRGGSHLFAVFFVLEGGGIACADNQ